MFDPSKELTKNNALKKKRRKQSRNNLNFLLPDKKQTQQVLILHGS